MSYRIFYPQQILKPVVEYYWYARMDLNGSVQQHYATPILQGLAFNFKRQEESHAYNNQILTLRKQAYIFGQPVSPRTITTNKKGVDILGVKFTPLGIVRITGINMACLSDQIIAAEDIWGNEIESLSDQMQSTSSIEDAITILENFLLSKHLRTKMHHRVGSIQNALSLIAMQQGNFND